VRARWKRNGIRACQAVASARRLRIIGGEMLYFRVFGPLRMERAGDRPAGSVGGPMSETLHIAGRRQRTILSLLLVNLGHYVSIERLIEGVWNDDAPPATCRKQVQNTAAALARALRGFEYAGEQVALVSGPRGYCLRARRDVVDALAFEDAVRAAVQDRTGHLSNPEIVGRLQVALELWTGDPFAGLGATELRSAAVRLEELKLLAIEELADLRLRLGIEPAIHIAELAALTLRHPTRERLWLLLMEALHQCGRTADALEQFRRYRAMLVDLHGIEPGQLIRAKERQLLIER
jgi:DNA-binding SARP family transcriptional activator